MNWYITKIVFRILTKSKTHIGQFDEQLRLIAASSKEEAVLKARVLGLNEEDYFLNNNHQPVAWEFINVLDVQPLTDLKDGLELYSNIREHDREYIRYVHLRAASLQAENALTQA
jgi:Domain of unknown function (DUF4288)